MGKRQPKRRPRGKAKPIPVEARRLAVFHRRVQRGETHILIGDSKRRLIPAEKWVAEKFKGSDAELLYNVSRALKHVGPEAVRVIHDNWPYWGAAGLQWKERQARMAELGFPAFAKMPRTTFQTLCTRLGLRYCQKKDDAI
jgi:hypothetical protein